MAYSNRRPLRPLFLAVLASGSLFVATAALAASMGVTFDGPVDPENGQRFGLSSASAAAAQNAGIGVLQAPMFQADGNLDIVKQNLQQIKLKKKDLVTPFDVESRWTAESDRDLDASVVYLVFTTIDPRKFKSGGKKKDVNYDPEQVGLRVNSDDGWVLLQTSTASLGTLYYPAVRLGPMAFHDREGVDVPYYLEQLITFKNGKSTIVPLPKLRIAVALAPIPEPGTALLIAAGLIALAARARAHS